MMRARSIGFAMLCFLVLALRPPMAQAGRVTEKYDNGKIHIEYLTNAKNQKSGFYRERWPSGRLKVQAIYHDDQLDGRRECWDEKGQMTADEMWVGGTLIYPKSRTIIVRTARQIMSAKIDDGGQPAPPAYADAVRQLMMYRYLCDVPYEGLSLDPEMNKACTAAAKVCMMLGHLTHNPDKNPGLPADEFELARKGAGHSNLFAGNSRPRSSIDGYMNDSDPGNIDRLGHRRWCLNPHMLKTGLGVVGNYQAMWSFDGSRPADQIPDWDYVAYPGRGYMPGEYFHAGYAWSITLNPDKYDKPDEASVKVSVHPVTHPVSKVADFAAEPAIKLDYFHIDTAGYAIANCVIFRPAGVSTAPGSRYCVVVEGVHRKDGQTVTLQYLVEFV